MGECPRCGCIVALHEGRPVVGASGNVERWHTSCWDVRHARPVEEVTIVAPDAPVVSRRRLAHVFDSGTVATVSRNLRSARRAAVAVAALAVAGAASYGVSVERSPQQSTSLAAIHVEAAEPVVVPAFATMNEVPPDLEAQFKIPSVQGVPLDELYPSLEGWIHPVIGSDLVLSKMVSGMFGAERGGVMRRECGQGHCGIDLGGPIGRPIVAVARGVVVHIERSRDGKDGRSGRYVRIEHPDGVLTSYMHMNTIRRGIDVGTPVNAGDQVGTLGNTGIQSASPHLHFSVELPRVPGTHGDHVNTRYIDPAPFLVRATMSERVDVRRPEKPAF